jgi:hypothetical protein
MVVKYELGRMFKKIGKAFFKMQNKYKCELYTII